MRRRRFLQLTSGAAGSGLLRLACAAPAVKKHKASVVVVGGGFAGATCALSLRRLDPSIDVTLIDPQQRYLTCPMSNSVLVGLRDMESISVERCGLAQAGVRQVRDQACEVDTQRRHVRLAGGGGLPYDRLVMAPGIRFLWNKPQGYDEAATLRMPHAWQAGTQTEILAAQLRAISNGGVVAISVPAGPMRCPPGPFERASLIAGYLKQSKPRCKVLIFDANNRFPRQDVFSAAWQTLYPGMIEWISSVDDGAVVRVAPSTMRIYTSRQEHAVEVANIIPPQAPALLAMQAGLASDHGWCPVNPLTFESTLVAHAYVIGDACIADPMPKSASAANAQAKQCALAIVAALKEREPSAALLQSVCYSLLAPGSALSIHGKFHSTDAGLEQLPEPAESEVVSAPQEAHNADVWYRHIVADSFGC
jgi:sulfide dehydrogenase [flavocytochrome c] flavoprotein chain